MSRPVVRAVYRAARGLGAVAGIRWLQRHRVPVLCYHSVVDQPLPPAVATGGLHVPAELFRAHMQYLVDRYRVVTLQEAVAALTGNSASLPERAVVLTFDDGYASNVRLAAPILREYRLRATCFLATAYMDSGALFWWDEVSFALATGTGLLVAAGPGWGMLDLSSDAGRAAAAATAARLLGPAPLAERRRLLDHLWTAAKEPGGMPFHLRERLRPAQWAELRSAADVFDFGGHSAEHRLLDHLLPNELVDDLTRCRRSLETRLQVASPPAFAYPAGRCTPEVAAVVRAVGFGMAVEAHSRSRDQRLASVRLDRWAVPRVGVTDAMTLDAFAAALVGLPGMLVRRRTAAST